MPTFRTTLVPGRKAPYTTWTFIELPPELATAWRGGPHPVRGTLAGAPFRGTASRGEGVLRVPIVAELLAAARLGRGDTVEVTLELDPEPRPVTVPAELQALLDGDPALAQAFAALPPSHRRAWAGHVAEGRREDTRRRRAAAAPAGILGRRFPGE